MEPVDTLICARWVLPVEPDDAVLENHAVAIRSGRIVAVLPVERARARYRAASTIERPGHALLPGLVNAHTHAAAALLRGFAGRLPLRQPLADALLPVERRWVDPEYVRDGTELAIAGMLRAGTTCFADAHAWPDVVARTAAELHMRASVGLRVVEGATGWAAGTDDCIEQGMSLRDEYRGDPLICTHFASPAPSAVDDATLLRVRRLADELEIPVAMPLHASREEIGQSVAKYGQRPLARLAQLGLASPLLVAVHATQVDASDRETLAAAGATVVHCPASDLRLGQGVCPVPALRASGVRVALGADGAASASAVDMFTEMHCAGLLTAAANASPGGPGASGLLRMATLEGARALGLGDSIGSLVPGKWADLCCVDLRAPRSWPVHDAPAALVHAAASSQVTDTWVAGRHMLADGALRYVEESSVLDRAEAWRARIAAGHETGSETHALPR